MSADQEAVARLGYARGEQVRLIPGHPCNEVHAVPGQWQWQWQWQNMMNGIDEVPAGPSVWMLGSSLFSARLASELIISPSAHSIEVQHDSIKHLADIWDMPSDAA